MGICSSFIVNKQKGSASAHRSHLSSYSSSDVMDPVDMLENHQSSSISTLPRAKYRIVSELSTHS